jgi:adenosylcobinamide-GDP ribazoletransferase
VTPGGARRAVGFLTVAPVRSHDALDGAALTWFPAVGLGLGAVLGAVWWGAGELWAPLVAATLVVAADLALTGLLHFDGLLDATDGLLPPLPVERRLEVMADPAVGGFAAGVGAVTLVLRIAVLAAMAPSVALLAAVWCASRTAMVVLVRYVPPVRPGGLAAAVSGRGSPAVVVVVAALALAVGSQAGLLDAAVALLGVAVGAGAVAALALRRLGGMTGDVVGAAAVVGETVALLLVAADW